LFISNFLISTVVVCRDSSIFVLSDLRRSMCRDATVSSRPFDLCICHDGARVISVPSSSATHISIPSLLGATPAPCNLGHCLALLVTRALRSGPLACCPCHDCSIYLVLLSVSSFLGAMPPFRVDFSILAFVEMFAFRGLSPGDLAIARSIAYY
jgi:hypothetical protein